MECLGIDGCCIHSRRRHEKPAPRRRAPRLVSCRCFRAGARKRCKQPASCCRRPWDGRGMVGSTGEHCNGDGDTKNNYTKSIQIHKILSCVRLAQFFHISLAIGLCSFRVIPKFQSKASDTVLDTLFFPLNHSCLAGPRPTADRTKSSWKALPISVPRGR